MIMVLRTFFASDNDSLVVTSSSSGGLVGDGIINNSDTPNGTIFQFTGGSGVDITLNDQSGGGTSTSVFEDDQLNRHTITNGGGLVANNTKVEAESLIFVRELDENGVPFGPTITITVFSKGGVTQDVWGFATDIKLNTGKSYIKTGGNNTGTSSYASFVTCFAEGTLIETAGGMRPVESIRPGDLVVTRDNGLQTVRWSSSREVDGVGAFAPVVFAPGAIGNLHELSVSQEHRMVVENAMSDLLFGEAEVLIAAKHLCGLPGVAIRPQPRITYFHIMFDQHQVVRSNGCWSESFFLADNAVAALEAGARHELGSLFPSLLSGLAAFGPTALRALTGREARILHPYLA